VQEEKMEYDRSLILVVHRQLIIKKLSYEFRIAAQFREAFTSSNSLFCHPILEIDKRQAKWRGEKVMEFVIWAGK
jgi:hypothetical protein